MTRFEDLPPVDGEGWLADQGRNFLQSTDARISRLRLPDFMAESQREDPGPGVGPGADVPGAGAGPLRPCPRRRSRPPRTSSRPRPGGSPGWGASWGSRSDGAASSVGQALQRPGLRDPGQRGRPDRAAGAAAGGRGAARARSSARGKKRTGAGGSRSRPATGSSSRAPCRGSTQGVGDRFSDLGTTLDGARDRFSLDGLSGLGDRLSSTLSQEDARWNPVDPLEGLRRRTRGEEAARTAGDVAVSEWANRRLGRGHPLRPRRRASSGRWAENAAAGLNFRGGVTGVRTLGPDVLRRRRLGSAGAAAPPDGRAACRRRPMCPRPPCAPRRPPCPPSPTSRRWGRRWTPSWPARRTWPPGGRGSGQTPAGRRGDRAGPDRHPLARSTGPGSTRGTPCAGCSP